MLRSTFGIAAAALAAISTWGLTATSASADSGFNGTYTFIQTSNGGGMGTWTVTSPCDGEGCVAHVESSGNWTADFHMSSGLWVGTTLRPNGLTCADGTVKDVTLTYVVDPNTLTGTFSSPPDPTCVESNSATFALDPVQ
ncbi:MAG TPA: hypothetical protein VFB19_12555 [Mycobacterium sp.]|nr:hypothetical protein [Mycobacterium sp.]